MRGSRRAILALLAAFLIPLVGRGATIQDVRIAFELKRDHLFVREMITLLPDPKASGTPESIVIPLAEGARQAQLAEPSAAEGIAVRGGVVSVDRVIPEEGLTVGVMFRMPVLNGMVAFEQSLGRPVGLAHAALLLPGEQSRSSLSGEGFSRAERHQTPEGLPALFTVGQKLEDGRVSLLVTGLTGERRWVRNSLAVVCCLMLLAGFVLWLRRKIAERGGEE